MCPQTVQIGEEDWRKSVFWCCRPGSNRPPTEFKLYRSTASFFRRLFSSSAGWAYSIAGWKLRVCVCVLTRVAQIITNRRIHLKSGTKPFQSQINSLPLAKVPEDPGQLAPWNLRSLELSFLETFFLNNIRSRETKVPGSELARVLLKDSLKRANWPGSEKSLRVKFRKLAQVWAIGFILLPDRISLTTFFFVQNSLLEFCPSSKTHLFAQNCGD